jgi:hypothetical protein
MSDLQCWCDWCRGRAGVHGEEARALYRRQCEAASGRIRVLGSADYSVLVCVPEQVRYASGGVIRAGELAAKVKDGSDEEAPTETSWRWSICTDCGMWDLVAGLRDPLCSYCGELRSLPPRPLMSKRTANRFVAAACAAVIALSVTSLFFPRLLYVPMVLTLAALAAFLIVRSR